MNTLLKIGGFTLASGVLTLLCTVPAFGFEHPHKWFCEADGYDSNMQLRNVSGDFFPTQKQAEDSAVSTCQMFGYMGCRVKSCIDEGFEPR